MVEKIGHIKNPLTVIAVFAAVAEISGTGILPFIESENQGVYIWFLMFFPLFLVGMFFLTLNFNHKVLYAPSDYKDENNFLEPFVKATKQEKENKVKEEIEDVEDMSLIMSEGGGHFCHSQSELCSDSSKDNENYLSKEKSNSLLMENVLLAEKLSIKKLSEETGLKFKTNLMFDAFGGRKIIFDGVAIEKDKFHAVEVKLMKGGRVSLSIINKVLLDSEIMANQIKGMDSKEFIVHFVVVIDGPRVDLEDVKNYVRHYMRRSNVNIEMYAITLDDLRGDHQYGFSKLDKIK